MRRRAFLATAAAVSVAGCSESRSDPGGGTGQGTSLALDATPFDDGGTIPPRYTCDGGDTNPELTISGVVDEAETLAIVVEDLDAGEYVHWTLWNVPASTETIPRSVAKGEQPPFAEGARQGENDAGGIGYVGPCPPAADEPHSYRFRLSAVSTTLALAAGASRNELADALSGNVIDSVSLTAQYGRD